MLTLANFGQLCYGSLHQDGKNGTSKILLKIDCMPITSRLIGKQSRLYRTWTIVGYLTSKMLLDNREKASLLYWEEGYDLLEICICANSKTGTKLCSRGSGKSHILL